MKWKKFLILSKKRVANISQPKKAVWIYRLQPLGIGCKGTIVKYNKCRRVN